MTGTSQDTTLIDLFAPLEGGIGLDAPDTQVITDSGIQKVQEDRRTHDRLAAIEAFAGWADAPIRRHRPCASGFSTLSSRDSQRRQKRSAAVYSPMTCSASWVQPGHWERHLWGEMANRLFQNWLPAALCTR